MLKRFPIILCVLVILVLLGLPPVFQVSAADDFHVAFDGDGDLSYTILQGGLNTGRTGNGAFDNTGTLSGGLWGFFVEVEITLPEDCLVTTFNYWYKHTKSDNTNTAYYYKFDGNSYGSSTIVSVSYNTWGHVTVNPSDTPADTLTILLSFGSTSSTGTLSFDDFTVTCDNYEPPEPVEDLTRPLASEDEHPQWGMFDIDYVNGINPNVTSDSPYSVYAYSNKISANVAAVAAGTVVRVTPVTPGDNVACKLISLTIYMCVVLIPVEITQDTFGHGYTLNMVGVSRVDVRSDLDPALIYTYYLTDPTVQVGDSVAAGCVLGKTIQLKHMGPIELAGISLGLGLGVDSGGGVSGGISISGSLDFRSLPVDASVTIVIATEDTERVSLFPQLVLPPNLENCRQQTLSGCVNANPDLSTLASWRFDSGITSIPGGGATIPAGKVLLQDGITVDPEVTYTLSVQARTTLKQLGGGMRLLIGSETQDIVLTEHWTNYSFTASEVFTPLVIGLSNLNPSSDIEVRFACLADSTASTAPGSCYFANNEFDADGSSWTISNVTFASGQAYMRHESTLSQPVTLLPTDESTSHTYTIRAQVRLIANSNYTGQVGKSVALEYRYPFTGSYASLAVIDSALVISEGLNPATGTVQVDYPYLFEDTFVVSEETISTFSFQVEVTDGDSYITGLRVDYVCIVPSTDDGGFPGQEGGGGFVPPLTEGCQAVPIPLDDSVAAWTYYHWSQLNRFFSCDLMRLLNKMFKLFDDMWRTLRYVARWWIALVHHVSNWFSSVFWWLDGHFRNISMGQVVVINEEGGCHDLFCALVDVTTTLANLLNPIAESLANVVNVLVGVLVGAVNLFFTLIGGLVAFVVALVIKLFTFLQLGQQLLTSIITAYNTATPTAIPGLPMCATDPDSSLLCRGIWVLDNTILGGRWGVLFTIILSILAIHLILWAIGEFKEILMKTWSSS